MYFIQLTAFAALAAGAVVRRQDQGTGCSDPSVRTEWRELAPEVQQNYIDAVQCLKTKPSGIGLETSLYDDFPYVHQLHNMNIHEMATFLPWHRYFIVIYEAALRDCGYTGAATYWDWTQDVMQLAQSPVMASELGFGQDGSDDRTEYIEATGQSIRCVDSGPFSNLRPSYMGLSSVEVIENDHCLYRNLADGNTEAAWDYAQYYNAQYIDMVQSESSFLTYHGALEDGPHAAIHSSLSGEMDPRTAPNDPLFFLHHAQIDRLWWKWQQDDLNQREFDYAGEAADLNPDGTDGEHYEASLDDILDMGGLAENLSVRDVMSTSGRLCYKYAN